MNNLLEVAFLKIDQEQSKLNFIGQEIWKNPELSFKEYRAHDLLVSVLEEEGFCVQKEYILPTAFRAEYTNGNDGPTVAVVCEYDALPEIGHACGHNLIAECGIAAGMALKAAMESFPPLSGKVVVLGTPAEESGGGKITMMNNGAFSDIDFAIMAHPTLHDIYRAGHLAIEELVTGYQGKEAHSAAGPWEGRNALDAAVAAYTNLAFLRQQIRPTCKIGAIISKGGTVTNIIPGESEIRIAIRASNVHELKKLRERVDGCLSSAAEATGCEMDTRLSDVSYANLIHNKILSLLYRKHAESYGILFKDADSDFCLGASTDFGNVSHVLPCMHPMFGIPSDGINHTTAFTTAAGQQTAQQPTLIAAKALAAAALEVMSSPSLLQDIKDQFRKELEEEMLQS